MVDWCKSDRNSELLLLDYDVRQNLTRVKTPGGKVFTWEYDAYDRIRKRTFPSGETLNYLYEGTNLQSIVNSLKRSLTFDFNDRMELERLTYPTGVRRQWHYDWLGRVTESRNVKGNVTRYDDYDAMDRIVQLTEPDGNVHHFRYDDSGNLIHAKDKLREVEFTYGPLGILTSRKQGNRKVSFGYNTELQLINIRNEKREIYDFDLDGLGQVVAEYGFDGLERRYIRDGVGRVVRVLRPAERWTDYLYDGVGNVIKETQYDGKETLYAYDNDNLLKKAYNDDCEVEFKRDIAGRIIEDRQNGYIVTRQFDENGNCIHTKSNLGADIRSVHNKYGHLQEMYSGDAWSASWKRDEVGLEINRTINSGLDIRIRRDRFGRETKKNITTGNGITQGSYSYQWGLGNRLLEKTNDITGLITTFEYNEFDDLISADYINGMDTETIYRTPDRIGALYKSWTCRDRVYDYGGKLLEDPEHYYHYDAEGNLIFKEYKELQPGISIPFDRKKRAKELGLEFKGSGTGWQYDWYSNGMLKLVIRLDGEEVSFKYDALGRRLTKVYNGTLTRWVWDGNTPLHECVTKFKNVNELNVPVAADDENLTTWVFENSTFVPAAKITKNE